MLVVIIVIAILGTNLLLGFFVANTMGYGPQTINELLTGIYKVPIGWTIKRLASGKLKTEHRQRWAQHIGASCPVCPDTTSETTISESAEPSEESAAEDDDDFSADEDMDEANVAEMESTDDSGMPADLKLIRQVSNFIHNSPILLDELRFQWLYLPKENEAEESLSDSDVEAEKESKQEDGVGENSSIEGDLGDPDLDENSLADDAAETVDSADPLANFWTKERLVESLDQWNDYLENYEPEEITWWLDWYGLWDTFAEAWRKHCTEVLAVGLVERLLKENQPEPEPEVVSNPVSVKAVKEQPKEVVKPKPPANPRQQWINDQYSRLLQSLFASSARLEKAQKDLLQFTLSKSLQQWDKTTRVGDALEGQTATCLPSLLELRLSEEFQPTFAILVVPDYRRLLEIDNGKLISEAVDHSILRTISDWNQNEQLSGQWYRTPNSLAIGLLVEDEATVRQKASWISQSLADASFQYDGFSLSQTCSVVVCQLPAEGSPMEMLYQLFAKLDEKTVRRRMAAGNALWQLNGKKLRSFARDEAETEKREINLDFSAMPEEDLPDLNSPSDAEDDGDDADW